jgi:GNAT superfamily N-acetyltransferase
VPENEFPTQPSGLAEIKCKIINQKGSYFPGRQLLIRIRPTFIYSIYTKHILMDIIIRKAVKEDCPRLLELIRELADYEKAPQEVTVTLMHFEESGFGENPVWWAFAAEEAGVILGFALYYVRYSTWKGQRMYLEDILVTRRARGRGIGKLLMDRLIEEAKEKKFSGIMWQVLAWNEPAINFYKKYTKAIFDDEWINCSINF